MANIFTKSNDATPKPNRNTFDGSFVNNLTLKMGQITPCFCKEVIPGDSFRINPTFGFNFQPFVFPVQTDMQANLHFFYVRNRALWKGWMDFITKTENLEGDSTPPYIMLTEENRDMFETGKIGDYLGVPTIYYSKDVVSDTKYMYSNTNQLSDNSIVDNLRFVSALLEVYPEMAGSLDVVSSLSPDTLVTSLENILKSGYTRIVRPTTEYLANRTPVMLSALNKGLQGVYLPLSVLDMSIARLALAARNSNIEENYYTNTSENLTFQVHGYYCLFNRKTNEVVGGCRRTVQFYNSGVNGIPVFRVSENEEYESSKITVFGTGFYQASNNSISIPNARQVGEELVYNYDEEIVQILFISTLIGRTTADKGFLAAGNNSYQYYDYSDGYENKDRQLADLPFASTANPDGIRVSALPFRAVEACYNSFYRDDRNNPLIIDGKPYYNVYVQDKNGGADTNHYRLYQRNWEADVFTTAVQSPQQGVAPLVGVTASGQMTFQDEEGKTYYLQAEFGEDGHTITGIKSYSSDMPVGTLRAMVDTISTGISINDFRNVNALQRWLETNMRKGLRYKDQIEAHFGTSPTYSELEMPEFIGGMSRRVEVNKVVQTSADQPNSPLGTLGGNATILGGNGSDISCYADEHGWIIGFITITPKPVYSQQLNKQLTKTQLLDYYFPEFAHIGFQPILNQEIAPLQCTDSEGNRLTDVFGYQRAWYEYLANVDEVHGDFRTTLKDYIIHRVFNGVPQLSQEFLTVSTDEANEVFAVNSDDDKIFGQIYFDVKMKRPLPTVGVPKLEVG